jgi:gliding motility-associated-like protein
MRRNLLFQLLIVSGIFFLSFSALAQAPTVVVSNKKDACGGASNGQFTVTVTGGVAPFASVVVFADLVPKDLALNVPYTYTGMPAGNHTLVVGGGNGESTTVPVTILNYGTPIAVTNQNGFPINNANCNSPSGQIRINVTGGTGNFDYSWTGPNGYTNNIEDITGLSGGSYSVHVQDKGTACFADFGPVTITDPSPIVQTVTTASPEVLCPGEDATITLQSTQNSPVTYQVLINGAGYGTPTPGTGASLTLTVPSGNFGNNDVLTVEAVDGSCTPKPMSGSVTINISTPPVPTITGGASACENSTGNAYNTEAGMTGYVWTINGGMITSGAGTANIQVTWGAAGSGTVTVNYTDANGCTATTPTSKTVTINGLPVPTISGAPTACVSTTGNAYNTEAGMAGYIWTISGGTITSGAGTNAIQVSWGAAGPGNLTVTYTDPNNCGPVTPTSKAITINARPVPTITGSATACATTNGTYSTEAGMTAYEWTVTGGTIASGAGTNSIQVSWGIAGSGNVTVTYSDANSCAPTTPTSKAVTINALPVPTITGGAAACENSIANAYNTEAGMTGYLWTVTGGTITSGAGTNAIQVTWGAAGSGTVTASYTNANSCTASTPTSKTVTINALPVPTITGAAAACQNSTGNSYSTEPGKTGYIWTVSGGTITSGAGTNAIQVTWGVAGSGTVTVNYTDNSCGAATPTSKPVTISSLPVPTITGSATACATTTGTYSTEAGMSAYVWTATGGTITSGAGTNSIQVTWGAAGSGNVTVTYTDANSCAAATPTSKSMTINALPVPTITGGAAACENSTANAYNTEAGMTGYVWTVIGGTITSGTGTNAIQVTWGAAGSGTVTVNYTNANNCTASTPTSKPVTVNALPVPTITGAAAACENSTANGYSTESGKTGYVWNVTGGTITSGAGTNAIQVTWGAAGSGTVTVNYTDANSCGAATPTSKTVTINAPPVPTITGSATACATTIGTYSTEAGMSAYVWTATGGTITSGAGTNSIQVTWGVAGSGNVTVTYQDANNCGAATPTSKSVTINALPVPTITGGAAACASSTGNTYNTEAGMTGYVWTVTGGTIASGTGTNAIQVTWGADGSGTVTVNYANANNCTAITPTSKTVTINAVPVPTITGGASACENSTGNGYSTESGKTGYIWTVTGGTITSGAGTNAIQVTWGATGPGTVTVNYTDANSCTAAAPTSKAITINSLPVPTITGAASACQNSTGNGYSTEAGKTGYIWTVTGGTITSGAGTNAIQVTWGVAGSGTVTVNYTDNSCGAGSPTSKTVTINALPVPTITGSATACAATTRTYSTEAGMSAYVWTATGGTITSGAGTNSIQVTWGAAGSGNVTVNYQDANNCAESTPISKSVTINAAPVPTINGSASACENSTGNAYSTEAGMTGYVWTVTGGTITSGAGADAIQVTWGPAGSGTVTVTYTDANNCAASTPTSKTVTINSITVANISGAPTVCENETGSAYSTESGKSAYVWTVTGGTITSGAGTDAIQVTWGTAGSGSVSVSYTDVNACNPTVTGSLSVTINAKPNSTITPAGPFCTNNASVTLTAATPGGTWSGSGITDAVAGTFDPSAAGGAGTKGITYQVAVGGCTSIATANIAVFAAPDATITAVGPFCNTDAAITLSAVTPGGTWSGTGITDAVLGTFNPASATIGANVITYTVTVGTCTDTKTTSITVGTQPDATITPVGPFCTAEATVTLTAVSPGGTWSGNGITDAALGTFDPTTAGPGTHTITYVIAIGGCNDTATIDIVVNQSPNATITPVGPFCNIDAAVALVAATPGGTWSGPGITDVVLGTFDPASANIGANSITYEITVGSCTDTKTIFITVGTQPDATITPVGPFCTADASVTLAAVSPGGTWSGTGITDAAAGVFDPATAGAGTHTITYSIVIGGCNDSATIDIVVDQTPDAGITAAGPFCITDVAVTLAAATPGGTWSGTGITDAATGAFDPATAGVGTHTITYSLTAGSCTGTDEITITVADPPIATITAVGPLCTAEASVTLVAVTPGGTWSGTGITDASAGTFDPTTAGAGTHTITYTISIGGCSDTNSIDIVVNQSPDATITSQGPFCIFDAAVTLVAATPGGTWSGTGITDASAGTFDPATAGIGSFDITYSITSGSCTEDDQISITVTNPPDATITSTGPFCTSETPVNLTAVTAGGTWSGTGITDAAAGTFSPTVAGVGTHVITYTITIGGCSDTQTADIIVDPAPDATITAAGPFCPTNAAVNLTATTAGGTWSGTGITDATNGTFDPAVAGTGTHVITYTIMTGGCTSTGTTNITVRNAADPACGGGGIGNCATVVITPVPTPATCTLSNGSILFNIVPFTPAVNNTGVVIEIQGTSSTNLSIARTNFNDPQFNALPMGVYSYKITYGDIGCIKNGFVTIDQSGTVGTPVASDVISPICAGSETGAVTIDVPGETGNLLEWSLDGVTWNSFTAGNQITGIPAGPAPTFERVISIRRNESDPCNAAAIITIQDANPAITYGLPTTTPVSTCTGADGTIIIPGVTGGLGAKQIRIYQITSEGAVVFRDFAPMSTEPYVVEDLASGSYYFELRDEAGCSVSSDAEPSNITAPGAVVFNVIVKSGAQCGENAGKNGVIGITFDPLTSSGNYKIGVSTSPFEEPFAYVDYFYTIGTTDEIIVDTLSRGDFFVFVRPTGEDVCPSVRPTGTIDGPFMIGFDIQRVCGAGDGSEAVNLANVEGDPMVNLFNVEVYQLANMGTKIEEFTVEKVNDILEIKYEPNGSGAHSWLIAPDDYLIRVYQLNQLYCIGERPFNTPSHEEIYAVRETMVMTIDKIKPSLPEPRRSGSFLLKNITGGVPVPDSEGPYYSVSVYDPTNNTELIGPIEVRRNSQGRFEYHFRNLPVGNYEVVVTDSYGCTISTLVIVPADTEILVPNIFTPNGDEVNDQFEILNLPVAGGHKLVITNRWGKEMFTSDDYHEGRFWDAQDAPEGIYYYRLDVSGGKVYTGWVEVTRGSKP